jgi:hypothetical protein
MMRVSGARQVKLEGIEPTDARSSLTNIYRDFMNSRMHHGHS